MYQDKSPAISVFGQLTQKIAERSHRQARRRRSPWRKGRRGYPSLSYCVCEESVGHERCAPFPWWNQLSHHTVSIGDENALTTGRKTNILTESVLQDLESNSSHVT
jgi:hypothetical protein